MKHGVDWYTHIESWKKSGLSKAEYCRQNDLNTYSFYDRSRKLSPGNRFVELPTAPSISESAILPLFEFHIQFPFEFRFKLNLSFGTKS